MAVEFVAYDGQVTFECETRTLASLFLGDRIRAAVPEQATFAPGSQQQIIFDGMVAHLGATRDIRFHLQEDADGDLVAFRDFWAFARDNDDYAAVWERYAATLNLDLFNTWWAAFHAAQPRRLYATPALQASAKELEDNPLSGGSGKPK